jgi:hypothetical protein
MPFDPVRSAIDRGDTNSKPIDIYCYIDAKVETADQLWVEMIGNFGKVLPMADYSDRHYSQTDRHLLIIVDVLGERHCPLAKFFFPRQVHSHNIPPPFLPQSTSFHSESDVDRQISKAFNGRT